jgi:hypothetical protein
MTRTRIALTVTTLGLAGLLGLSGCGAGAAAAPTASPVAQESAAGDHAGKKDKLRRYLRENTLHGEIAVQGKDGVRTVVVQRGTVTAADGKTISVKSTDGFTLTWTAGEKAAAKVADVRTGAKVGLAGHRDGDVTTASLVVLDE